MTVYTEERPASAEAIAYVLDHLWAREDEELRMLGTDREKSLMRLREYVQRGPSMALRADGEPICVTGACMGVNGPFTWLKVTEDFKQHAHRVTRILRRELRQVPGAAIYTPLADQQAGRWIGTLGFKRDEAWQQQTIAGYPLFRYVRGNNHV